MTFDGNNFSITNTYTDKPLRLQQDPEHYATKFVEFEDLRPKTVELEFKGRKWRTEITPFPTKISDPNYHHETKQKLLVIDGVAQGFTSSDSLNFDKLDPTKAHHILIHHIGDDARIYKTDEQNTPIKDSEPDKTDDSEDSDNPSNSGDSNKTNDSSNPSNPNNSTNPDPSEPPKPPEEPEDNHFGDLLRELDILKHNAFSKQTENLTDRLRGIFNKKSEDKKDPESGKPDKQKTDNKSKPDKHSNSEKNNENHNNNSDAPNTKNHQEDHSSHSSIESKEKSNHQKQPDSITTQDKDTKKLIPAVPDSGMPRYLKRRLYSK